METPKARPGLLTFENLITLVNSSIPNKEDKIESIMNWHHNRNIVHLQGYIGLLFTFIVSIGIMILRGEIHMSTALLRATQNELIFSGFLISILLTVRKEIKIKTFVHSFMDCLFLIAILDDWREKIDLSALRERVRDYRICTYTDDIKKRKEVNDILKEYYQTFKKKKVSK